MDIEQQAQVARDSGICQTENFEVAQGRDEYCKCGNVIARPGDDICMSCHGKLVIPHFLRSTNG